MKSNKITKEKVFLSLTMWMITDAENCIKFGCLESARRSISIAKHYLSCAKKYSKSGSAGSGLNNLYKSNNLKQRR